MFENLLYLIEQLIALMGVVVIVYSAAKAVFLFSQEAFVSVVNVNRIRLELGYGVILALEFLVAADIVGSIAKPNYYDIGMLAALVLIRTFLSYFLNLELQALKRDELSEQTPK